MSGSFGSFGSALGVVGVIKAPSSGSWVHSGAHNGFILAHHRGSFGFVGVIPVRPGDQPGSLGHAHGVIGLIRFRWVHSGAPWGSLGSFGRALGIVGFNRVRWVYSGAPWVHSGSFGRALGFLGFIMNAQGVVGFIQARP